MQLHKLYGGQLLVVLFHKLVNIIAIHLQYLILAEDTISLTIGSTEYRLRVLNVTFNNTLRPKLLPSRSEGSLGNPFPCIFNHFEAGNDIEVIFQIFSNVPVKREPKIEYLPWYKAPNSENSESTDTALQQSNKTNVCEGQELETEKCSSVGMKSDENTLTDDKLAFQKWNKPAEDKSENPKENNENKLPMYRGKYRPVPQQTKKSDDCRQQ
ncbi:hypothetical protein AVEN_179015-1 [Araneus ventricosus]|uniref:Uncharacterized protein n=1 Tax=Araneus ventricosus TaxID=182803 RepID=A0A4Y2H798_ARAVE|nr:hypothetical protein AVEN_179015-1 [Araneus ventricosus]